jgi:hypothetical protein
MYATCLFCSGALGHNEAIEHFPVGRRLAFDAAKGRLWVVCPSCSRWNLTPLETRWEAIEEAERAYRDTKLRASTDNIGLAKLREGTELVRIGKPMLPEFAGWRYGAVFKKRYRRSLAISMLPTAAQALPSVSHLLPAAYPDIALGISVLSSTAVVSLMIAGLLRKARSRLWIRDDADARLRVSINDAGFTRIVRHPRDESWHLRVSYHATRPVGAFSRALGRTTQTDLHASYTDVHGAAALRALTSLLPAANWGGAPAPAVQKAVAVVEQHGNAAERLREGESLPRSLVRESNTLANLHAPTRLALEMMLHEADERRALDGELHELAERWREAEAIAAISDAMFMPDSVDERIDALQRGSADR